MKRLSVIAVLLSIVIAGCGGGEQPVAEQPAAAAPEQATVETGAPAAAPTGEEAQPVMVEESAAEEEDAAARELESEHQSRRRLATGCVWTWLRLASLPWPFRRCWVTTRWCAATKMYWPNCTALPISCTPI